MLKLFTFGFGLATLGLAYLCFADWYAWSMVDFDYCAGTYWQCHRSAVPYFVISLGIPVVGWATYGWLLIRAWKTKQ